MGSQTRQIRAAYRESATFRHDRRETPQLLSTFIFATGVCVAMLAGATSFSHNPAMQQWLRWAASVVMFLACAGIGWKLLRDGFKELQRARQADNLTLPLPAHLQPSRSQAVGRLALGIALGICAPLGIVIYQMM